MSNLHRLRNFLFNQKKALLTQVVKERNMRRIATMTMLSALLASTMLFSSSVVARMGGNAPTKGHANGNMASQVDF